MKIASALNLFEKPTLSRGSVFLCLLGLSLLLWGCSQKKATHSREPKVQFKEWAWEELGPKGPTEELNPGGIAVPAYAVNRGNGPGRVNYLKIHPSDSSIIFACSPTGGLFISRDSAQTWEPGGTDRLPISGLAAIDVHPSKPDTWFVVTGDGDGTFTKSDGVWRTTDAGITWENINGLQGIDPKKFRKDGLMASHLSIVPSEPNRLIMAGSHGLWVTENALEENYKVKWKRMAQGYFYNITIHPTRSNEIFASGEQILFSKDAGLTWQVVPLPKNELDKEFGFNRINVQLTPASPDTAYVIISLRKPEKTSENGEGSIWKLVLNDKSWSFISALNDYGNVIPSRCRAFALHPLAAGEMLIANIRPVYRSTNFGKTFSRIKDNQLHDDVHHLVYTRGGKTVYSASDGGVAISFDGGLTWEKRENGLGVANVFGLACGQTDQPLVVFGAYDTGGNLLRDNQWYHVSWGDGFEGIILPTDSCTMFVTRQNGSMLRSSDCGLEFEKSVSTSLTSTTWHTWTGVDRADNKVIYLAGSYLIRSFDLGNTWEKVVFAKDLHPDSYTLYRFYMSPDHPDVMYVYVILSENTKCMLYRTRNLRESDPKKIRWEAVPESGVTTFPTGLSIDPNDPLKFWITYDHWEPRGKIFRFDGYKYHDIGEGLEQCSLGSLILEKGSHKRLYLGTTCGLFTRSKSEKQWTRLGQLPGLQINSLDINYRTKKLFVGTFGRGVWTGNLYRADLLVQ